MTQIQSNVDEAVSLLKGVTSRSIQVQTNKVLTRKETDNSSLGFITLVRRLCMFFTIKSISLKHLTLALMLLLISYNENDYKIEVRPDSDNN